MRRTPRAEIDRRVREAADALVLGGMLNRRPAELSGGERQRVALGRAMVRRPAVLLLDEPVSDLDAPLRRDACRDRATFAQLQAATIYVTHDQAEAMTLGHRIAVMDQGVIQQIGPPMEVYERPVNRFVASFIGSPGMNLIAGEVRGGVFHAAESMEQRAVNEGQDRFSIQVDGVAADGPVVLGIRPNDLVPGENGQPFGMVTIESGRATGPHNTGPLPNGSGQTRRAIAGRRRGSGRPKNATIAAAGQESLVFGRRRASFELTLSGHERSRSGCKRHDCDTARPSPCSMSCSITSSSCGSILVGR